MMFNWERKICKLGPVVELVTISACHAEGHGFESRQDCKKKVKKNHLNFVMLNNTITFVKQKRKQNGDT